MDRAGQLGRGGIDLAAAGAAHELLDVVLGEAAQVEAHDVIRATQVGKRVAELDRDFGLGVPKRREHQHAG